MELELAGCQGNLAWHSWRTHKKGNLQVKEEAAAQESNLYYCQTHLAKKTLRKDSPKLSVIFFAHIVWRCRIGFKTKVSKLPTNANQLQTAQGMQRSLYKVHWLCLKFSTTGAESNSRICTCFWVLIATTFCEKESCVAEKNLMQHFVSCGGFFDFSLETNTLTNRKKWQDFFPIFFLLDKKRQLILYYSPQRNMHYKKRKMCFMPKISYRFMQFSFPFLHLISSFQTKKLPIIIFVMLGKITRFNGIFTSEKPSEKIKRMIKKYMHIKPRLFSIRFFLDLLWQFS